LRKKFEVVKMWYEIIISIIMGLLICLVPLQAQEFGCECSDETTKNSLGSLIGNCLTEEGTDKSFCYVKDNNPVCCQAKSAEVSGHCKNYDLCDSDFIDAETSDSSESSCKAVNGPGNGLSCVFPFKHKGRVYYGCSPPEVNTNNLPWCSTKVDDIGDHITGNWGNCDETCPLPKTGDVDDDCSSILVTGRSQSIAGEYLRTYDVAENAPKNPVWKHTNNDRYIFNTGSSVGWRIGKKAHLTSGKSYYKSRQYSLPWKSEKWTNSKGRKVFVECKGKE